MLSGCQGFDIDVAFIIHIFVLFFCFYCFYFSIIIRLFFYILYEYHNIYMYT